MSTLPRGTPTSFRIVRGMMKSSFACALFLSLMWIRSGMRGDYVIWDRGDDAYTLRSDWGYLAVAHIPGSEHVSNLRLRPEQHAILWESNGGGYAGSTYGPETWRWYT